MVSPLCHPRPRPFPTAGIPRSRRRVVALLTPWRHEHAGLWQQLGQARRDPPWASAQKEFERAIHRDENLSQIADVGEGFKLGHGRKILKVDAVTLHLRESWAKGRQQSQATWTTMQACEVRVGFRVRWGEWLGPIERCGAHVNNEVAQTARQRTDHQYEVGRVRERPRPAQATERWKQLGQPDHLLRIHCHVARIARLKQLKAGATLHAPAANLGGSKLRVPKPTKLWDPSQVVLWAPLAAHSEPHAEISQHILATLHGIERQVAKGGCQCSKPWEEGVVQHLRGSRPVSATMLKCQASRSRSPSVRSWVRENGSVQPCHARARRRFKCRSCYWSPSVEMRSVCRAGKCITATARTAGQ